MKKVSIFILICYSIWGCNPQIDITDAKACFSYNSSNQLTTDTLQFTNCSENSRTYLWSFGDGNFSEEATPKHNYSKPGIYTAKLIAKNEISSDTITENIEITKQIENPQEIKVCFNAISPRYLKGDTIYFLMGDKIKFENCSEKCSDYLWSFGDGIISKEVSPLHIYLLKGSYSIKLFAKNQTFSDSISRVIKIMDYTKVKACYNTDSPYYEKVDTIYYLLSNNPVNIQFNNCSENATSFLWSFDYIYGNSEATNPSKMYYTNVGSCKVSLIAKNLVSSDTIVKTLCFIYPLNANFSGLANKLKYNFKSDYNGVIESYNWDFGDGTFSTEAKPEHVYSSGGEYSVKLTVSNKYSTESLTKQVICTLFSFPLKIDIDNDNIYELTSGSFTIYGSKSGRSYYNIRPVNGIEISSEQNGYGCKLYENGATVEDSTFRGTGSLYLYYNEYWYSYVSGGGGFQYKGLLDMGPKYLAFRKKYGSIYKYGWIRISLKRPLMTYYGIVYGYSEPKEYNEFIIKDN